MYLNEHFLPNCKTTRPDLTQRWTYSLGLAIVWHGKSYAWLKRPHKDSTSILCLCSLCFKLNLRCLYGYTDKTSDKIGHDGLIYMFIYFVWSTSRTSSGTSPKLCPSVGLMYAGQKFLCSLTVRTQVSDLLKQLLLKEVSWIGSFLQVHHWYINGGGDGVLCGWHDRFRPVLAWVSG